MQRASKRSSQISLGLLVPKNSSTILGYRVTIQNAKFPLYEQPLFSYFCALEGILDLQSYKFF